MSKTVTAPPPSASPPGAQAPAAGKSDKQPAARKAVGQGRGTPVGQVGEHELAYDIVGATPQRAQLPKVEPSPPFLFVWHPDRWNVLDENGEYHVVPQLVKMPLVNGVSGVQAIQPKDANGNPTGKPRFILDRARAIKEKRGMAILAPTVAGVTYCRSHQVASGVAHLTPWELPRPGSKVLQRIPGYVAWLRKLVDDQVIPLPDLAVLEAMRGNRENSCNTYRDMVARVPSYGPVIKKIEAELAAIDRMIARVTGADAAAAAEPSATGGAS